MVIVKLSILGRKTISYEMKSSENCGPMDMMQNNSNRNKCSPYIHRQSSCQTWTPENLSSTTTTASTKATRGEENEISTPIHVQTQNYRKLLCTKLINLTETMTAFNSEYMSNGALKGKGQQKNC